MYDFEWFERALTKLRRDFAEGSLLRSEFDKGMGDLQRRKAEELEFMNRQPPETYGEDGLLWA
jgi:hypothetical protein